MKIFFQMVPNSAVPFLVPTMEPGSASTHEVVSAGDKSAGDKWSMCDLKVELDVLEEEHSLCRMEEVEKEKWTAPPPCRIHPRGGEHTWPNCLECQAILANPPWNEAESQKQTQLNAFSNDDRIGPMSEAEAACLQDRQKAWLESLEPRGFVMSLLEAKRTGLLPNDFQPSPSTS